MSLFQRIRTTVKADAHGVIDALEDRALLLRQCLRDAETELSRKRQQLEVALAELRAVEREEKATQGELSRFESDAQVALFAGNDEGWMHCVDPANGAVVWKFEADGEVLSGTAFHGDTVLFGCGDEHLYCVGRGDGKLRWKFNVPGGPVQGRSRLRTPATLLRGSRPMARQISRPAAASRPRSMPAATLIPSSM